MMQVEKTEQGQRVIEASAFLWAEKYRAREDQGKIGFLSCIHCGRDTSKQGRSQGVCVSGGGSIIVHPEDYDTYPHQGGEMGWYPVGSECIKQIPADFRAPNPYQDPIHGV
jgi:hypothetical protein